ncbi:MAG TPA: CaiB/BaiF CoA-transferase family protein, partial [Nitriliruptoraceae bacterium]|nr:CaiB/BaiF CoA-transferase family protein [Nitriliruptoraceae bacterium]
MPGPLHGVTIIELAAIGPTPLAGMVLADLGAEVIRVERPGAGDAPGHGILNRSRTRLAVDLKDPDGVEVVRRLATSADGLVEGFRPGVLERLGLAPDDLLQANPALVIGRMTGWGQDGPWARAAGHDINYIAVTGALDAIGRRGGPPAVPLNLVGDFGGGAMFLVVGMLAGLLHARSTGQGQVVDAAMVDGASALMAMFHDLHHDGLQRPGRGTNLLDSGAWFYDVYECSDGKWVAVGPIEPQFRADLVARLGLDD